MDLAYYNSCLYVDTRVIRDNIRRTLAALPAGTQLIPVLKCDAYGLGLGAMTRIIRPFSQIGMMAVAQPLEALQARAEGFDRDILVLGAAFGDEQYRAAVRERVTLNICRPGQIPALAAQARAAGTVAGVHIKINTGLNRLGAAPGEELGIILAEAAAHRDAVRITGIFSHFSDLLGEDAAGMRAQALKFVAACDQAAEAGFSGLLRHMCASAGWETHPEWAFDAVRIGRGLFYDHPHSPRGLAREAVSWRARVLDVHPRRAGDRLGYGGLLRLKADTVVAMLGIGYGDGLDRGLVEKRAPVLLAGRRARLLACCMDQTFVDTAGIPCAPGDEVTLFGADGRGAALPGREAAALIADEACTLTSALGPRIARVYV